MSYLFDYIAKEFQSESKGLNSITKDTLTYKQNTFKKGKNYTKNHINSLDALQSLKIKINYMKEYFDDFVNLVPDDIAKEVIEFYESYNMIENRNSYNDNVKFFKETHIINLFQFAIFYGQYNRLDEYYKIWMKLNCTKSYNEAITTKAEAKTNFSEACKIFKTSDSFIRGCISILDEKFDVFSNNNRIKITQNYKQKLERANKLHLTSTFKNSQTNIEILKKNLTEIDRSKFR